MTSLVAILNRQAVALAADSAVTTHGSSGPKIFNSVNKLFTLSKYHPVGIMVYSAAEVLTMPVETAIKSYRQQCGHDDCATLQEYCDRFSEFLKTDVSLFPHESRVRHAKKVINAYLVALRDYIMRVLQVLYPDWGEPTRAQVKLEARRILQARQSEIQSARELPGVTQQLRKRLRAQVKDELEAWRQHFRETFNLSNQDAGLIYEIGLDLLLREYKSGFETGFVVAGFGKDEYAPQLRSFELESSVFGIHKFRDFTSVDVSTDGPAIVPFAQTQMVETFVQGREHGLDSILLRVIDSYFKMQKLAIRKNAGLKPQVAVINSLLDTLNDGLKQELRKELHDFGASNHVEPILTAVNSMPKEELAIMAEALVNLTSIKRRMSPDAETVGGPTDVAVISKGDGFIWIKRKHYFQAELNPGFGYNYYKR